jgi:hypothetical protein
MDAPMVVFAPDSEQASAARTGLLLSDPALNQRFAGATVSVRIKPPEAPVPIIGLTIHVDELSSRGDARPTVLKYSIEGSVVIKRSRFAHPARMLANRGCEPTGSSWACT